MRIRFRQHSTTWPRRLRVHVPALSRSSASDADPYDLAPDTRPEQLLTPRELEVLAIIADGATSAEIADRLSTAETTVQSATPESAVTSVVVVDGRPADRELLATVLGHAGYTVAEAATGEVAIRARSQQQPDLIITHILMPDMDGYELVNKRRSEHVTADIRVIFYTATYLLEAVRRLAGACGVSRILVKPCEPGEIIRAVSEALSSPPVSRVALTSEEFHREHLRVLSAKLSQKIDELHDVARQATESLMLLEAIQSSAPVVLSGADTEEEDVQQGSAAGDDARRPRGQHLEIMDQKAVAR